MVNTRRQNAKENANPSKPVFRKEQNDLKIQQVHEYSLHATGQYSLNKFVLSLNDSSTETDMKTAYRSMTRRFHPDKNIGLDTSKTMTMINEAKDGLENTLLTNDAIREKERVRAAADAIQLCLMTIQIQRQEIHHPNQQHYLIKYPHFQLNTVMIMKKHP